MIRFSLVALLIVFSATAWAWTFQDISADLENVPQNAGTIAWGDVNGDGFQDLFVGGDHGSASAIYLSDGMSFTDATEAYDVGWISNVRSAQFLDYNLDGRLDLFCTTDDETAVALCRQEADQRMRPIPISLPNDRNTVNTASWRDLTGDGYPELILSQPGEAGSELRVFEHTSFEFVEQRAELLPERAAGAGSITWANWKTDASGGLFLGGSEDGNYCGLYSYSDGQWFNWAQDQRLHPKLGAFGAVWSDFDNNGYLDLFCPGPPEHVALELYLPGEQKPNFKNAAAALDLSTAAGYSFDAHAVDANMDGWTDIYVLRSDGSGSALLINNHGESFTDVALQMGISNPRFHNNAAAWGDFDADGDMDLAIAQEEYGVRLYRNNAEHRFEFVTINLCQSDWSTVVAGCQVFMRFENSKAIASTDDWCSSNGGDGSSITLVSTCPDKSAEVLCQITWPTGEVSEFDLRHLRMNKVNTLYMPTSSPRVVALEPVGRRVDHPIIGNAPNPFNPSTTVSFNLNTADHVTVSVFDMLGREVAILADAPFAAGEHRITFDAGDLPSGQYLARLSTSSATVVHRMTLLK